MDKKSQSTDLSVPAHIQYLVQEEHRLFEQGAHGALSDSDRQTLATLQVELDQCWDLLRQRRALRETGQDPNMAEIRSPQIVEKYEQ